MSELLWSVDFDRVENKDRGILYIEGWLFAREKFEFQLQDDCGKKVDFQVEWKKREDVRKSVPLIPEDAKIGFTIQVVDILSVFEKASKVSLAYVSSQETKPLWDSTKEDVLQKYGENTIQYQFDRTDCLGGKIYVFGWAVSQQGEESFDVENENGEKIPFRVERFIRRDVNEALELKNQNYPSAFNISIPRDKFSGKTLYVYIKNEYTKKTYSLDMKTFNYEHSKKGRFLKTVGWKQRAFNKQYIQEHGWNQFVNYVKLQTDPEYAGYNIWMKSHIVSKQELSRQSEEHFAYEPLISVIIPLYNTPIKYLREIIDSLLTQSYKNIEICLADGSTDASVGAFINKNYKKDSRVRYKKLTENKGISENTNAALDMASGEYIMLSDHDDVVAQNAVYEIVKAINQQDDVDVVYTDEDKVTMDGKKYFEPNFKPDYNLDFLRSNNYICHIFVVRTPIIKEIGGFRKEFDGAQDFDLILRCCEQARRIVHVPKVLYHWRSHENSTATNPESKMYAFEAGRKALEEHYKRTHVDAQAKLTKVFGRYRSVFSVQGNPLISIIIPNKDHIEDLEKCLNSIAEKTTYRNYEILIVENNSTEKETFAYYENLEQRFPKLRMLYWDREFNYAAINNYAVKQSKGEYILFLNNDVELITENWLEEMVSYCQREDVGIVGAKLYYPDETVQHAGVIIGLGGVAGHIFSCTDREEYGYMARLISTQDLSAVTAACMMTPRKLFDQVGGFDEKYQVAFNDVDYCMKIRESGHLVVYHAYVELYHYESKSRGKEETEQQRKRFQSEMHLFQSKWPDILKNGDPYYNPNLTVSKGDCSLKMD
ncbi:MAG: glycosyltransferase family 2 protein [Lachnospiraceae bacterium]|nr:glycosyltransferase family 2 protein [Lachnospiraceae bacterium]MDD3615912.1 glycosyltransferase family 2 protein [Lachnospiraceae bacterium]